MTLVRAFEDTEMPLKIVGYSSKGYDQKIKEYLTGKDHKIEFVGKQSFRKVREYLSECAFTVCPSECYDNSQILLLNHLRLRKQLCALIWEALRRWLNTTKQGFYMSHMIILNSGNTPPICFPIRRNQ